MRSFVVYIFAAAGWPSRQVNATFPCSLSDDWYSHGSWEPSTTPMVCPNVPLYHAVASKYVEGRFTSYIASARGACDRLGMRLNESHSAAWRWVPDGCELRPLDAKDMARRLSGRRVFVIGDSISDLHYHALACVLSGEIDAGATSAVGRELWEQGHLLPSDFGRDWACKADGGCASPGVFALRGGGQVEMLFSDLLVNPASNWSISPRPFGKARVSTAWAARLAYARPTDIVILNTGPHFKNMTTFQQAMRTVLTWLRDHFPGMLIWRDFYPGMPEKMLCDVFRGDNVAVNETGTRKYNWGLADDMNKVATLLVAELGLAPRTHMMRVRPSVATRCDRKDGLHFCTPGVANEWAVFLYNRLLFAGDGLSESSSNVSWNLKRTVHELGNLKDKFASIHKHKIGHWVQTLNEETGVKSKRTVKEQAAICMR